MNLPVEPHPHPFNIKAHGSHKDYCSTQAAIVASDQLYFHWAKGDPSYYRHTHIHMHCTMSAVSAWCSRGTRRLPLKLLHREENFHFACGKVDPTFKDTSLVPVADRASIFTAY